MTCTRPDPRLMLGPHLLKTRAESPLGGSTQLRLLPLGLRALRLYSVAADLRPLCQAQCRDELGMIATNGAQLFLLLNWQRLLMRGVSARAVLRKQAAAHAGHYPAIRVALSPAPCSLITPVRPVDGAVRAEPPRVTVVVKRRRQYVLPSAPRPGQSLAGSSTQRGAG